MSGQHTPLIWGQRVEITDETHPCFGRVGRYEGVISAEFDALRVRFSAGVIVAKGHQLCATSEHPVCINRRLKAAGVRPLRHHYETPPTCYTKDYGKTSMELAVDAWLDASEDVSHEESKRLFTEMMRLHRRELLGFDKSPRRVAKRAAIAKATGSAS